MTLRLDPRRLAELQRQAREAGLRPGQLAQRWVEERLDRREIPERDEAGARGGGSEAAPRAVAGFDELSARIAEHASRLDQLAAQIAELRGAGGVRTAPATAAPATDGGRRPRLHEEIIRVLQEAPGPMSAGEIAQAIRERGQYRAPRSNEQVNGAMVSGRVSNPHYRALFVREGRRIGLSERPAES